MKESIRKQIGLNDEEINKLQEWTQLKIDEILIDSNIDDWDNKKFLKSKIFDKSNLLFLFESYDNIKFGFYLNNKIDREYYILECYNKTVIKNIIQPFNSFLFSFKNDKQLKYKLNKPQDGFKYPRDMDIDFLFSIGENEIKIDSNLSECYVRNDLLFSKETNTESSKQVIKKLLILHDIF